jgi:hypothetical protein
MLVPRRDLAATVVDLSAHFFFSRVQGDALVPLSKIQTLHRLGQEMVDDLLERVGESFGSMPSTAYSQSWKTTAGC